jgi:hypothetical protein
MKGNSNCLGLGDLKMDNEFKNFLQKREISEERYETMGGDMQFKWSEHFENRKAQGDHSFIVSLFVFTYNEFVFRLIFIQIICLFHSGGGARGFGDEKINFSTWGALAMGMKGIADAADISDLSYS